VQARLFWLISRFAIALYRRFPVFGAIRGSIAIIHREGGILALERNDGLGVGLPGGIVHPWESAEQALRREVTEETGLTIVSAELLFTFDSSALYPARTSVFLATVHGSTHNSWEGTVRVFTIPELEQEIISSQRLVIDYLRRHA
jgi:8-oxo-dGTP pyrophosphatase MutT (NUDIX family)